MTLINLYSVSALIYIVEKKWTLKNILLFHLNSNQKKKKLIDNNSVDGFSEIFMTIVFIWFWFQDGKTFDWILLDFSLLPDDFSNYLFSFLTCFENMKNNVISKLLRTFRMFQCYPIVMKWYIWTLLLNFYNHTNNNSFV